MNQIGQRLREERERLGLSQTAIGAIGGVQQNAQFLYEKDQRSPNADYLHALAQIGADTHYIVTGQRSASALTADEKEVLIRFRNAPLVVKATIIGALQAAEMANKTGNLLQINAPAGEISGGDTTNKDNSDTPENEGIS